jgi:hypothetical protein
MRRMFQGESMVVSFCVKRERKLTGRESFRSSAVCMYSLQYISLQDAVRRESKITHDTKRKEYFEQEKEQIALKSLFLCGRILELRD